MSPANDTQKIRVAVLGGGVSALTTAFELTSTEALRARYDVTLYQLGWRLGGKGASGRNQEIADRIEEHGLHIWMGFYENAFRVMRAAYEELGRNPDAPLATWKDAFHPHSYIVLEEKLDDGFHPWQFVFPTNYQEPGSGGKLPSPLAYAQMLIQWIIELWESSYQGVVDNHPELDDAIPGWISRLIDSVPVAPTFLSQAGQSFALGTLLSAVPPTPRHPVSKLAAQALRLLDSRYNQRLLQSPLFLRAISWLIQRVMKLAWLLLKGSVNTDFNTRKLWVGVNLAGSAVAGILADNVIQNGWDSIDGDDLRTWLKKHGANQITLDSGPLRGIYDLVFGYIGGEIKDGAFAAGTAMRGVMRMLFTYKGAIFFRMQGGMGDVVATPFYEVLQKRGVKFEYFHRVDALRLSDDKSLISKIELTKQVKLREGRTSYNPLVDVGGLACWPSAPLYAQIEDGEELKASGINLESAWSPAWKDQTQVTLELGRDFDQVVLGISIAALQHVAKDLVDHSPMLAKSIEKVKTVQTQALQLWLSPQTAELGWKFPRGVSQGPVLGAFYEPIDTWADMSDLIRRESWPDGHRPGSIAYFCGPFKDAAHIPPFSDHAFPSRELARYKAIVRPFLDTQMGELWPNAVTNDGFMWELLIDLANQRGPVRLDSQYMRVNLDPTERYVLSVPGSTQYRLRANALPYSNLVLSGDWTYNGLNAGCVEASVMGGLYASRALCGVPEHIVGDAR